MSPPTYIPKGIARLNRMRDVAVTDRRYRSRRRHSGDFIREYRNVFVESCRALGALGNGRPLSPATPRGSRSRERRACGEAFRASLVVHEQEVRGPRSGIAVVPRSLIV